MNRKHKRELQTGKPIPIRKSKSSRSKTAKGFGSSREDALRSSQHRHHYAIELNKESIPEDGNLRECEVEDVLEIRHISVRLPAPKALTDKCILEGYMRMILETMEGNGYLSYSELLATLYLSTINDYALDKGANIGRLYHNSCLGDTRIRANSLGHLFEPCNTSLPLQACDLVEKYVTLEHVADGSKVTLRDRLGKG